MQSKEPTGLAAEFFGPAWRQGRSLQLKTTHANQPAVFGMAAKTFDTSGKSPAHIHHPSNSAKRLWPIRPALSDAIGGGRIGGNPPLAMPAIP
jgi:hypothetical protein